MEYAYGIGGELYVKWAAETALSFNTTVPWVMCAQEDAPDPIVSTHHVICLHISVILSIISYFSFLHLLGSISYILSNDQCT